MISVLIFCHKKREANLLYELCRYCTALMGDEKLSTVICYAEGEDSLGLEKEKCIKNTKKTKVLQIGKNAMSYPFKQIENPEDFEKVVSSGQLWDLILFEVKGEKDLINLRKLRQISQESLLFLVVEKMVSPEAYLQPCIQPLILLLKPYDKKKAFDKIRQTYVYYYEVRQKSIPEYKLMIRCGEEQRLMDYTKILYMETREKKLLLHCEKQEFSFYGSLKEMEKILPSYFIRCHRSFLVNFMYVSKINLSQNILCMNENIIIPISQKYKRQVLILLDRIKKID